MDGPIWITVMAIAFRNADCLSCFHCSNKLENEDCTTMTQCRMNEKCYVERSGQGNHSRFSFGCMDSQRCPSHHDFTIVGRSTPSNCMECCIQDGCNRELCEISHGSAVYNPGLCVDDPVTNCSQLDKLINICTDIQHAKTVCRKYCELCTLVDGDWTIWAAWSQCSTTCGSGIHTRRRTCTNPAPQHRGYNCTGSDTQTHSCFPRDCPVHGEWSDWASWEGCSVSCDEGVRKRHRTCTNPAPSLYGHYCIGDPVEYTICHEISCSNVTTNTNSSHPATCADVSSECAFANRTSGICNMKEYARKMCKKFCGLCAVVDGQWSGWSSWGTCSTTCNSGSWTRTRTCTNPAPANRGKPCTGINTETATCHLRTCPVHGGWSPWEQWTTCSSTCGQGITRRVRQCTNPRPSLLGNYCFGDSTEYGICLIKACPEDGQWTEWSVWSGCSASCGSGQRTRQRSCSNPRPQNGGHLCSGPSSENQPCQAFSCPVNGAWSSWSAWTACSQSCNGGEKRRHRTCSNPFPAGVGRPCVGNSDDIAICNAHDCPVFTIGFSAQGRTLTSSYVMRFTKVVSNVGNGYSSTTEAFTCDHPGLYYFSLTGIKIHSLGNTSPISCAIRRNHIVQTTSFTDPNTRGAYSTGTSLVIHLAHGDRVDVGNCTVAASLSFLPPSFITAFVLDSDSTFSGFLLQSD